jgi:hypothetical protein
VKAPKEADVLRACLQLLRLRHVVHWRQNSAAFSGTHKGRRRFFRTASLPGVSDIIFIAPGGRFGACEVKRPGEKPTPAQQAFLELVRLAGGVSIVVDDVMQLARLLDELGV